MSTIVTRAGKGSPLTNTEVDANFTNLNTDKLEINAALGTPASVTLTNATGLPISTGVSGLGTGVATALAVNVGSAGAPVVNGGALGTPASGTLTNATGLPTAGLVDNAVTNAKLRDSSALSVIGRGANSTGDPADIVAGTNHQVLRRDGSSLAFGAVDLSSNQAVTGTLPVNQGGTGITSFGSGVAAFLGTPSSANLAAAVTDETGTGALVFANSPTLVTPALGTPSALVGTNITGTAAGLTAGNVTTNANLTGAVTSVGNATVLGSFTSANLSGALTDETGTGAAVFGTNPVIDGVTVPARTNPLAQAVRVAMTAAASGSNGIQVLDNANLRFGLGDFTLHWDGVTSGTTTTAHLISKLGAYAYEVVQLSTGFLRFNVLGSTGGIAANLQSTVVNTKADAKITVTYSRGSPNDTVTFYVDGVQLGAAVTTPTRGLIDPVSALNISGRSSGLRENTQTRQAIIYNRALSAAEVLSLSVNGPALADLNAKQLELVTDGSFTAGDTGWTKDAGITIVDQGGGDFEAVFTATSINNEFWRAPVENITTGRYRVTYTITSYTAGTFRPNIAQQFLGTTRSSAGTFTEEVEVTSVGAQRVGIRGLSASNTARVDDISIVRIGITGQWNAEDAQSNTGQIFDSSGNKNHALLPAAGATIIGKPVSGIRQVRWTNTWAGTNELQYIGGVNQAILPANAYIESIVGTVTGATPHDIIIGDGSDTDRYVTITTGLAAGTTTFTLANRTTDGTNRKLTVDPDTDATMSIAWVITFTILET